MILCIPDLDNPRFQIYQDQETLAQRLSQSCLNSPPDRFTQVWSSSPFPHYLTSQAAINENQFRSQHHTESSITATQHHLHYPARFWSAPVGSISALGVQALLLTEGSLQWFHLKPFPITWTPCWNNCNSENVTGLWLASKPWLQLIRTQLICCKNCL